MKTTLRLLLPACLLLSGLLSTHFASATPAGYSTGAPAGNEAPPVLGTRTWTGAVSTDWHDPNNWSPVGTPLSGSIAGDDVVIPVVVSGNYPVVTAAAAARSISIDAGASLNVNAGGTLNVNGSATDGVTNAGTITNAGTMLLDSSNDGFVNQANALIENSGLVFISSTTGNRLENYGTVTNTGGTFNVVGGLDIGLINHPGATITNTGGTFQVYGGMARRVDNYGSIANSATFTIEGAAAGEGLINHPNATINNTGGTFLVQNGMARRVDNYGSITNSATFTINGAAAGEGLVNHANATISNTGGTFSVQYGMAREVENYGAITNTATFNIYGGLTGECLVNRAGASVANNSGSFTVGGGNDMRVDNYGSITNAGTFKIQGASSGRGLFNRDGAVVTSTAGTFEIDGGNTIQVENDGKITNSGTFKISGTSSGDDLINRDTVINNAGGTFSVELGEARILDNSGYVYNAGALILRYCSGFGVVDEAVRNQANAKIINAAGSSFKVGSSYTTRLMTNHGLLQIDGDADISACWGAGLLNTSTGTVNVQDSLSAGGCLNYAITNENIFTLGSAGILAVKGVGGDGQGFINSGSFSSAVGSSLFFSGTSSHFIQNNAGGVFENNSTMRFENSANAKILNAGRYTHLNGTWKYDGGNGLLTNNGYFHLNVPITNAGSTGASLFYNTDSLILGVLCNFTFSSTNYIFINDPGAYLYSDAQFTFENIGSSVLDNKGKAVMGPSSVLRGKRLSGSNVISNTDSLFLQGTIEISRFFAYGIQNTGYTENSGSFFSNYTNKGILNNGGTFINSGSLRLDSISTDGLLLQGAQTFTNTSTGTISTSVVMANSIKNEAGSFLNEGEIELGVRDSMGNTGIYNQAQFTNKNLITIGGDGDVIGQNGIQNVAGGNLLNRGTINIGTGTAVFLGDGIRNEQSFTNDYCAEINLNDNLNNSGTFDNNGVLNINTNQAHTNTGTFTNRGTVNFIQPGSISGQVDDPFVLTCPDDLPICQYASPLDLSTLSANPSGGAYSGTAVSGNMFNPTTAGPGMHTITYTYTHYDGCTQFCTFKIEVIAAPVATATPSPESICSGEETDIALSSDVPGSTFTWVVQSTSGNVSGQADDSGNTITQTLSVNDGNPGSVVYRITPTGPAPHYCVGQTTDVTVNITANEITSISCPGPLTVTCAGQIPAPNPGLVSATDLCGNTLEASHLFTSVPYNVECINRFQRTRWYQVEDQGGNTASCSQVITVYDNAQPNFSFVPANVTVQCNSIPSVGTATANDGCAGAVTVVYDGQTVSSVLCTDKYTLTRQWTATDACGNTRTATQRITVIDSQKPNFTTTPANVTVQCDAIPAVATPAATDNCDPDVAITYNGQTKTNGACTNAYTLTRRWTAADNCGNTRTISQRITVVDNGKPYFTSLPPDGTISCTDPIPAVGAATATDGCGTATVTYLGQSTVSGSCPTSYQIRRTWRATDACGNSTVATQTIQVSDTGAPVFTSTPGPLTIECGDPLPPLVNPTASDACGGYAQITFLGNVPSGSGCAADYTVTRTWRAEDLCGNSATTSQVITVLGNNNAEEEGAENRAGGVTRLITHHSSLIVNPNPTTDRIWLELTDFAGEAVTVSIFSDLGQLIWENRIPAVQDLKLPISLREAGAAAGIYTVSVRSVRGVVAKRVVLVE